MDTEVDQLRKKSLALLNVAFDVINKPEAHKYINEQVELIAKIANTTITKSEKENTWIYGGYSKIETPPINADFILRLFTLYPRNNLENNTDRLSTFVRAIPVGYMRRGTIRGMTIITIDLLAISALLVVTPVDPLLKLAKRIFKIDESAGGSIINTIDFFLAEIRKYWNTHVESNNELKDKLKHLSARNNEYLASVFCSIRRPFSGHYAVLSRVVYGLEGNVKSDETSKLTPFVLAVLEDLTQGFKKEKIVKRDTRYDEFFKRLVYFDTYCDPLDAKQIFLGRLAESAYKTCVPEDLYSRFSVDRKKRGTHMSIADFYLLASHFQTLVKAECEKQKRKPENIYLGSSKADGFSIRISFKTMTLLKQYNIVVEPNDALLKFFKKHGFDTIYDRILNDREYLAEQSRSWGKQSDYTRAVNGKKIYLQLGAAKKKKKTASAQKNNKTASAQKNYTSHL